MNTRIKQCLAAVCVFALALAGDATLAGRGGGMRAGGGGGMSGGYRGGAGGGVSRPSYSGNGSIRYSAPSASYARPATPSYAAPRAPVAAQRPAGGYGGQPAYRPSSPGMAQRPVAPAGGYYRPPSSGSIIHGGTYTGPGGSTIGAVVGPAGGGAVGIKGSGGGTAGAVRGPGGGAAAKAVGPGGGTAGAVRGPGGAGAAGVVGPGGGAAAGVRGPGGAAAAGAVGPRGGTAGAVRGPGGGTAAGVVGPGGAAAGAIRGPGGYGAAGVRGPYGNRYVTNLPAGAAHYPWRGNDYWHAGYGWYRPYWVGDSVYYGWAYPPIGFYYSSLPDGYSTVMVNNTTYYESDGVYYQEGEQDGQKGYVVAEAPEIPEAAEAAAGPEAPAAEEGPNPFVVLKAMCDYVAGLQKFSLVAQTTSDEVSDSGDKIQVSGRRTLWVSRPDRLAFEATGDMGSRRCVYDGKSISLLDRTKNFYSTVEVPNTIDAALDTLARDYGIVFPLGDLLYTDLYKKLEARLTAGQYLGLHTLDGAKCHHLAFSSERADAELWVDAGDQPLLRRITIDYRQNAPRSRYSADLLEWNVSPTFNAETFEFKLPSIVRRIEVAPVSPQK